MAKLGLTLQQLAQMGVAPPPAYAGSGLIDPTGRPGAPMAPAPQKQGSFLGIKPGSKGAMIAGIIGDTLASLTDGQPIFTMNMMRERQQRADAEASEAQWSRRREADNQDWMQREQWQRANPAPTAPSELERVLEASGIQRNSPQWTQAMQQRRDSLLKPDPEIIQTLPNGQLYVGPRSGLASALTGGGAAAPAKPVGRLTPVDGGPTQTASATFLP
jgi:hypothetical protein